MRVAAVLLIAALSATGSVAGQAVRGQLIDSISIRDQSAGEVKVYLNGVSIGDVNQLRGIRVDNVRELRFLGAAEAQQRYGVRHRTEDSGALWGVAPGVGRRLRVSLHVIASAAMYGTVAAVDSVHISWHGAAMFLEVAGHKQAPDSLDATLPENWAIMNGGVAAA